MSDSANLNKEMNITKVDEKTEETTPIEPGERDEFIDVMIVMDSTGSMQTWINSARDTVLEAFDSIKKDYPVGRIRLGLVCYRDFDVNENERFVLHPLTDQINDVQNTLRAVKAKGGDDQAEDVAGGLEKTLEAFRLPHPASVTPTRICLFVADQPAHGLRYHAITVGDRYPKGDPNGLEPYQQVSELATMGVDMTVFRIDKSMDKMIETFSEAYNGKDGTFVLLDVVKQFSELDRTSLVRRSFDLPREESLASGFIDLASYDSDPYRGPVPAPVAIERAPSDETFRTATYTSVAQSIERRREKSKERK